MKRVDVDRWEWFAPRRLALKCLGHLPRYLIDEREFRSLRRGRPPESERSFARWVETWKFRGPLVIAEQVGDNIVFSRPVVVCESENMRAIRLRRQLDFRHPEHRWMI